MSQPQIEIIPMKDASRSDAITTLDVLIRITPPMPEVHFVRPPINLGLAIDRSGSMASSKKMDYAITAACFVVEQLLPTDRISVTIFDGHVDTIAPNSPAVDKLALIKQIKAITPRGGTNLQAGYMEASRQANGGFITAGLNRVILLSDGLANEGVTDPNAIVDSAKSLIAQGLTTTTMGLGDDYNEDLMQAMGREGGGNYYYIESSVQLVDIFQTELQGLMANVGARVSLGLEPQGGVVVAEVFNELDRNELGRLKLPDLVIGMPISVLVRLTLPPSRTGSEACRFRLAWDAPGDGDRRTLYAALAVPAVSSAEWDALPVDPEVAEQVALIMVARAKKEAISATQRGEMWRSTEIVELACVDLAMMPTTTAVVRELAELNQLKADLDSGAAVKFLKRSAMQAWRKNRGHDA